MAMQSGLFDSTQVQENAFGLPIGNKAVNAEFFARCFSAFLGNGIFGNADEFQISVHDLRTLKIQPGQAMIEGHYCFDDEATYYSIADAYEENINLTAVLRLDRVQKEISVRFLKSMLVTPIRNANYYDLILARIFIPTGASTVSDLQIMDTREDPSLCGRVRMKSSSEIAAWQNEISMKISGGGDGSVSFDGSKDVEMHLGALNMNYASCGVLPIAFGGTGSSNADEAREYLGAAAKEHKTRPCDIEAGTLSEKVICMDAVDSLCRPRNIVLTERLSGLSVKNGTLIVVYGAEGRGLYLMICDQIHPISLLGA